MQCLRACFIFLCLMYMIKKEPTKESFLSNLGNWDMFGFERCFRKSLAFGGNHQRQFVSNYTLNPSSLPVCSSKALGIKIINFRGAWNCVQLSPPIPQRARTAVYLERKTYCLCSVTWRRCRKHLWLTKYSFSSFLLYLLAPSCWIYH